MKVTFLGTGTSQGVPVIACECEVCASADFRDKRLRTSVRIDVNGKTLVIDSGPDFRQQMLRSKTKQLDALIFTHEHKDHIAGLDDIRAFNYITRQPVSIYASNQVQDALKREFAYIFADQKYPGIPDVSMNTIHKDSVFWVSDIEIIPIEVFHYYLPVLGFRIQNFAYITDANRIEEAEYLKLKGVEVLVINALRREKHISHFTLDEAIQVAQKVGAKQTYLTHLSHQMGLHNILEHEMPQGVFVAYDGLEVDL